MKTIIVQNGKILHEADGFYPMEKDEIIFIDGTWYKVVKKSLHFPAQRLVIEVS
jgi:hypothetical protein